MSLWKLDLWKLWILVALERKFLTLKHQYTMNFDRSFQRRLYEYTFHAVSSPLHVNEGLSTRDDLIAYVGKVNSWISINNSYVWTIFLVCSVIQCRSEWSWRKKNQISQLESSIWVSDHCSNITSRFIDRFPADNDYSISGC